MPSTSTRRFAAPLQLDLDQLCAQTGLTPRTVRYYIQQGLIASPGHGAQARYNDGHLQRLHLIRILQRERLNIPAIRKALAGLDDDAVAAMLAEREQGRQAVPPPQAEAPAETAPRSQWERITVSPSVEIHVRRPLSRQDNRRLEELLELARKLYLAEHP